MNTQIYDKVVNTRKAWEYYKSRLNSIRGEINRMRLLVDQAPKASNANELFNLERIKREIHRKKIERRIFNKRCKFWKKEFKLALFWWDLQGKKN